MPPPLTLPRIAPWLASAFAAATLAVLLAALSFAQPTGDDFGKAANGHLGIAHTLRYAYFEHGGRWNTNLLQSLLFSSLPVLQLYPLLLIGNLAFLSFVVYRLLSPLGRLAPPAALLFLLILWTSTPNAADTFFWATGGVEYLVNPALGLLLLTTLLQPSLQRAGHVWSALLVLYLSGSHELIVLTLALLLAACAWAFHQRGDPRARRCLLFAGLLALSVALLLTSPGSLHRASAHDGSFQPARALVLTAARLFTGLPSVLFQAPVLLATLWIVLDRRLGAALFAQYQPKPREPFYAAVLLFLLTGLTLVLPAIALGGYCPPRAITLATLELLLGWFLLVALVSHRWAIPTPLPAHLRALLPAALCAALFFSPTCQAAARAVAFSVPAWSRAVHLRYLDLQRQAAAGVPHAIALPTPGTPVIYFDFVLAPSPAARPNYFAARYFGFETIAVAPPK